jgi:AcrR family transcriptional regulator
VDAEALRHAADLLHERGYEGLRMKDVALRSGAGLGALYRRWPSKRELVLSALQAMADEAAVTPTDDPEADLAAGLINLAEGLRRGVGTLLASLLSHPESELSAAILAAKHEPFRKAHLERLRRVIGDVPDLRARADIGPALVIYRTMTEGYPPSDDEIKTTILDSMTGGAALPVTEDAGTGGAGRTDTGPR